jgi:transcriptional regulator with XRE-family HTH domain
MGTQPRAVLGEVLLRAREGVNRSPEQVGSLVGISGRTVRRLEAGEADRPRRVTLEALAGFYGLNPDVVAEIAEFKVSAGDALLRHLRKRVEDVVGPGVTQALEGADGEAVELAMRLARLSGSRADGLTPERGRAQLVISYLRGTSTRSPGEHTEVVDAFVDFLALDRTRQTMARQLLRDLRRAQESDGGE